MICLRCRKEKITENVVLTRQPGIHKRVGGPKYIGIIPLCFNCMSQLRGEVNRKSKTSNLPPIDIPHQDMGQYGGRTRQTVKPETVKKKEGGL